MEQIDSFIFDLDGTLLDTANDIQYAVNYAMRKYGLKEYSKEEIISFIGHGSKYLIERAMDNQKEELFDEIFKTYYKYYISHFDDFTFPYIGIIENLKYAKNKGIKLFVYTNKPYEMAAKLLSKYFGKNFFIKIVAIRKSDNYVKPNPILFLDETKTSNIDYNNSYYFGDSEVDILTSKNLNIKNMVSVTYGYKTRKFLSSYEIKPKYIIDTAEQIRDIVDNKNLRRFEL